MKEQFIYTMDIDVAEQLQKLGFKAIKSNHPKIYMFINKPSLQFSSNDDIDRNKIMYTNKLVF